MNRQAGERAPRVCVYLHEPTRGVFNLNHVFTRSYSERGLRVYSSTPRVLDEPMSLSLSLGNRKQRREMISGVVPKVTPSAGAIRSRR